MTGWVAKSPAETTEYVANSPRMAGTECPSILSVVAIDGASIAAAWTSSKEAVVVVADTPRCP
jgi:hypothetical protein